MPSALKTLTIAGDLQEMLDHQPRFGLRVHSVFEHSVNFQIEGGGLISLLTAGRDIVPMGFVIAQRVLPDCFSVGDAFSIEACTLLTPDKTALVTLQTDEVWKPEPLLYANRRSAAARSAISQDLIKVLLERPSDGIYGLAMFLSSATPNPLSEALNKYERFVMGRLERFMRLVSEQAWKEALDESKELIGFGPGLTPSCDDFLAAGMASLYTAWLLNPAAFPGLPGFNASLASLAFMRTSSVSWNMLQHAAEGRLPRPHQRLLASLFFETGEAIEQVALQVLKTGETSGADFVYGLLSAQENCLNLMPILKEESIKEEHA